MVGFMAENVVAARCQIVARFHCATIHCVVAFLHPQLDALTSAAPAEPAISGRIQSRLSTRS